MGKLVSEDELLAGIPLSKLERYSERLSRRLIRIEQELASEIETLEKEFLRAKRKARGVTRGPMTADEEIEFAIVVAEQFEPFKRVIDEESERLAQSLKKSRRHRRAA